MLHTTLVSGKTLTIQAASTISAATAASPIAVTTGTHGLNTGDIVLITGVVGNVAANGKWVVTVVDSTHFSLNGSTGTVAYTSGGSVAHLGFQTAAVLTDNTVFPSANPDFTVKFQLASLTAGGARIHVEDSKDSGVSYFPGPWFSTFGSRTTVNDSLFSAKREDYNGAALGNSGDKARINVYLEGTYGVAPAVATVASFNAWIES